jgi:hypothetical protein
VNWQQTLKRVLDNVAAPLDRAQVNWALIGSAATALKAAPSSPMTWIF